MGTRIIAVLNQKGGVGKTTTCANLGAGLARWGKRVLLIDLDPQANLTVHMGLEPHRLGRNSYSLLLGEHGIEEALRDSATPGLHVVASTLALANAEIQLASTVGRELVLREALQYWLTPETGPGSISGADANEDEARPPADIILIDCPPSLGILTMNALCAASDVLLPIQTEFFALQGVAGILESLKAVQRLNRGLRLSMVVPCLVDRRTTLARDVLDEVRSYFGDMVTRTEIRQNIKLAEAPSHGQTIFEYCPRCHGAEDYAALAAEVLGEDPDIARQKVIDGEFDIPVADEPAPAEWDEVASPAAPAVEPTPIAHAEPAPAFVEATPEPPAWSSPPRRRFDESALPESAEAPPPAEIGSGGAVTEPSVTEPSVTEPSVTEPSGADPRSIPGIRRPGAELSETPPAGVESAGPAPEASADSRLPVVQPTISSTVVPSTAVPSATAVPPTFVRPPLVSPSAGPGPLPPRVPFVPPPHAGSVNRPDASGTERDRP